MQTYSQVVTSNQEHGVALFDSPHAEEIKKRVKVVNTDAIESDLGKILNEIADADLRDRLDSTIGKIARAYEKLGFVEGYLSELAYACIV